MERNHGNSPPAATGESRRGREWSQGLLVAGLPGLLFWGALYLLVDDQFANQWWCEFALAGIAMSAFLSTAWLTCAAAEYLERRGRKPAGEAR